MRIDHKPEALKIKRDAKFAVCRSRASLTLSGVQSSHQTDSFTIKISCAWPRKTNKL